MHRMHWRRALTLALPLTLLSFTPLTAARKLTVDDFAKLRDVSNPRLSPDGAWVVYSVRTVDTANDRRVSDLWMTRSDGSETLRLTSTPSDSEGSAQWSPDGRYIAFVSSRQDEKDIAQLWLLDRRGGEAQKLTEGKIGVNDFAWSPDSKRIVFAADDAEPEAPAVGGEKKTAAPIVIDRFYFKEDRTGYLGAQRQHLYLLDVATKKVDALTSGAYNEALPSFSPDGQQIAFVSKRHDDFDRSNNFDLWVIDAKAGATPRQLTTYEGDDNDPDTDSRPAWSPDGKSIAYLQGGVEADIYYAVRQLAIIPAAGGAPRLVQPTLDRNVNGPQWSSDGKTILALLEEDRSEQLVRIDVGNGKLQRLTPRDRSVQAFDASRDGRIVVQAASTSSPAELFSVSSGTLKALTTLNQAALSDVTLGRVEELDVKSKDGTMIGGFVVFPPDYVAGKKYPTVLRIHGGPVSQFSQQFSFEWQLLAANGYVVIGMNPRGSSGRGAAFSRAIYADWGNKDTQDVLAAVDAMVARGVADPERLGVGGWSYGGILTNYVIASDTRFKAATSGASISNVIAGYGTDMYVREYEAELGPPWKNPETWMKISYPFLKADRIKTPTLFLCGEKDFNVPLLNSEQMYQALRTLGVPTQLIIYPGQFHGLTKPSYLRDRFERYVAWYDKYLLGKETAVTTFAVAKK